MADRKTIYVNTNGDYEEVSVLSDSVVAKSFKTANYELENALLGKLAYPAADQVGLELAAFDANGVSDGTVKIDAANKRYAAKYFQPFHMVPTYSGYYLQKVGTPTGNLVYRIAGDSAGSPDLSGSSFVSTPISVASLPTAFEGGAVFFNIAPGFYVPTGNYWLEISIDGGANFDASNYVELKTLSTGGSGLKSYDGTTWTTTDADGWLSIALGGNQRVSEDFIKTTGTGFLDQSFLQYDINFGGNDLSGVTSLTGLATPVNDGDAARKKYVDDGLALKLALAGGTMSGNIQMGDNNITGLAAGVATTDAVNFGQVQALLDGITHKRPVRVATTAALTLSAPGAAIDGVTLAIDDRVLVKNQAVGDAEQNGIYVFNGDATAMTRASDFNEPSEIVGGVVVSVSEGTVSGNTRWMMTSDTSTPIVVGTDDIIWDKWYISDIEAGHGITRTGDIISVDVADLDGGGLEVDSTDPNAPVLKVKTKAGLAVSLDGGGNVTFVADDAAGSGLTGSGAVLTIGQGSGIAVGADAVAIDWATLSSDEKAWKASDLAATGGAGYIGIADSAGNFTGTTIEAALAELALAEGGVRYKAAEALEIGDLVYINASGDVAKFDTISESHYVIGVAGATTASGQLLKVMANDEVVACLTGATPGQRMYWDGDVYSTSIPSGGGSHVWRGGVAKSATELHVEVEFVKKNA